MAVGEKGIAERDKGKARGRLCAKKVRGWRAEKGWRS
jgi:hypothetical protein